MSTAETRWGTGANAEAIQAWDGPLFDRFVQFRPVLIGGLGPHGDAAIHRYPPPAGARVLDIGCGFGDTAQQLAAIVGPEGDVLGVDAAPRFIAQAEAEAREAGVPNVRFRVADVQVTPFEERFDHAFSRMGTMFFASPVAALRNVREALVPGGRLVMVVWRRKLDNDWLYRAQQIVERIVPRPEEHDEPTCGPGPFSMADADTVSEQLLYAGFTDVTLHRQDLPILMGRDVEEAIAIVMALGPAGEILRLQGDRAAHLHGAVADALREGLRDFMQDDGSVVAPASTWTVTAVAPA